MNQDQRPAYEGDLRRRQRGFEYQSAFMNQDYVQMQHLNRINQPRLNQIQPGPNQPQPILGPNQAQIWSNPPQARPSQFEPRSSQPQLRPSQLQPSLNYAPVGSTYPSPQVELSESPEPMGQGAVVLVDQQNSEWKKSVEVRGSLSFNFNKRAWAPCLKTSPNGLVDPPGNFPEFEFLREDKFRHFMNSSGKLINEREGISQSGFWVEGGFFIATLHFGSWARNGELPTQDILESYREKREFGFGVSAINHNIAGHREDDNFVEVYLWKWNLPNDMAVFRPVFQFNEQTSPRMIPLRCLVESELLFQYLDRVVGVKMFAVGYNNPPDKSLADQIRSYMADTPATHGAPPDYDAILWPFFKSVAIGSLRDIDIAQSELLVDCSLWKGFFGGLVAVRYPETDGSPLVIGHMIHANNDEKFNRAKLLPSGLCDYLKSACNSPVTLKNDTGEMGFRYIKFEHIHTPVPPLHSMRRQNKLSRAYEQSYIW
ncbi:hypothetical protein TWF730_005613 [Orbilia blumenaviensis]|uniref:Uncharacterized protein n=1 Tax=Orbilia blumenaviensis TaxID=1796055 RepID=A0AAV9VL54_9PEZI